MLLMEFHGSPASVKEQAETVQDIASEFGGNAFEWASTPKSAPGCGRRGTTPTLPPCKAAPAAKPSAPTPACPSAAWQTACSNRWTRPRPAAPYFLVGHVGDGNFHFGYLLDPNIPEERVTAEALNHKLVARALSMGGTCTGEHGVGVHKMGFCWTKPAQARWT